MQFDHIGIVTTDKKEGEIFVPATRVWRTEAADHPFRVEWLRFEPDSPVVGPVREMPHVAYSVDDVRSAGEGMEVLLEPFDVGPRIVGFYRTADGTVVEFVKHKEV